MTQITVKDESEAQDRTDAPVISVRAVTKRYGDTAAVDRIDLDVREGEFISLLGPSGCGKTTLLRMLGGFEDPDEGEIELHGRSVLGIPPHKRTVNTVFQAYALFPHMTVAENVAYGLRQRKVPRSEVAARVAEVLRLVRMVEYADRPPRKLSGGQQQRVALARAIVNRPSVLLLDEPMSALDRNLREQMQIELKLIQRQVGITFLFVTHDQEEALSMSDRIVVMQKGTIKQIGTAQEVYERPATAFVAEFIGKQNFFGGTVAAGGTIDADETSFRPSPERLKAFPTGARVEVGLRAETVTVHAAEPDADTNQMRGTLAGTSFLGDVLQHVVVTGAGREVLVRTPASSATPLEVGSTVWCSWGPDAVQVFDAEEGRT